MVEGNSSVSQSQVSDSNIINYTVAPVVPPDYSELEAWLAPVLGFILFAIACVFGALIGKALNWFKW